MGYPNVFSTLPSQSLGLPRQYTEFYLVGNGSSAPLVANVVGSPIVSAISRTSAGVLVVTLASAVTDINYASADMDDSVNDGAYATIGSWANLAQAQPPAGSNPTFTLNIRSGINPSGTATLASGTVTVATGVPSGSSILLSYNTPSGTTGQLSAPTANRTAAHFVINSSSGSDASTVDWTIVQPQYIDLASGRKCRVSLSLKTTTYGSMK